MKVLFYIDCLASGGKERRFTELIKALSAINEIDLEIALMSYDIHFKEILDLKIKIHYLIRKTKKDITIFHKLYKLCKTIRPDAIHCWDSMTAVYSAPVCKILKIPLINGMVIDSPGKFFLNKSLIRAKLVFPFSDYIIGNSYAGIKAYGASEKKSFVIHNGFNFSRVSNTIDKNIIRKQIEIKTKFVVGMVATFSKYKDYKTYFDAAQLLLNDREDITFIAIGKKTDSFFARSLISSDKLEHFRLLGEKNNVESYINIMDICILSTFTEGISNSILEYMASGKPVIASDGGGTKEIVEDRKTGFLVKVSDAKDTSDKIGQLLDDENLRFQMGAEGKLRIQELFSIEKMLSQYIILYNNILLK